MYIYSDIETDQILTVYRHQTVGSKSVKIFGLSLMFLVRSVLIFKFLTVLTYSVMTYLEKVQVFNL